MAWVAVRQIAAGRMSVNGSEARWVERTYLRPAWKSRYVPDRKNAEAMTGDIQWMFEPLVQPNQNRETGRKMAPIIATGRRLSGTKSAEDVQ